ncbi:hypothetical protein O59_002370 [Cellvibrio sp. BR]|nr:hypothetical protein O59_002370 [Cellvibrio sp. BR]
MFFVKRYVSGANYKQELLAATSIFRFCICTRLNSVLNSTLNSVVSKGFFSISWLAF